MESSPTNAADGPTLANEGTVHTDRRTPPTTQEPSSHEPSLPPGMAIELGLVPVSPSTTRRKLAAERLEFLEEERVSEQQSMDRILEHYRAQRDELSVEVEKLQYEKAQLEEQKRIMEAKMEAEVRYRNEVIECLRTMLETLQQF
ncbi:hypothetical protein FNAPI_11535 [Fusarium napiforme]|uniref:Uncharacterized protein n=1 Tax=Fusarium napiforme TaxID=42672 RepID=A0A8H5IGW9_9HYPO|nr:hypothetical protein FNAPI_11535 [Fusarium napiforme]